ncbi:MAG: branched-chain amino acid ABC transporter permease, partial [Candidatus Wolframiiraptor sp.]
MALPVALTFLIDLLALLGIFAIISLSLNIEFGYTGIPNFGKLLAVAGGAFFVGAVPGRILAYVYNALDNLDYIRDTNLVMTNINRILSTDVLSSITLLILSLLGAAFIGAILGFIASYPAIRLREDYLAITLLAMAEILVMIGRNYEDLIGGTRGVAIPDPFRWVGGEWRFVAATCTILVVLLLILFYVESISRSPLGRTLRAIRDDEISAEVFGKDVVKIRMKVLMVGSSIAAVGGAL